MSNKGFAFIPVIIVFALISIVLIFSLKDRVSYNNPSLEDVDIKTVVPETSNKNTASSGGSTGCNDIKKPSSKLMDEWRTNTSEEAKKFFEPVTQEYINTKLDSLLLGYGGLDYSRIDKWMKTYKGYDNDCEVHSYHYYLTYHAKNLGNESSYSDGGDSYSIYFRYNPRTDEFDDFKFHIDQHWGDPSRNLIPKSVFENTIEVLKGNDLYKEAISKHSKLHHLYWKPNIEGIFDDDTVVLMYNSSSEWDDSKEGSYYNEYTFEVDNFSNSIIGANKSRQRVQILYD